MSSNQTRSASKASKSDQTVINHGKWSKREHELFDALIQGKGQKTQDWNLISDIIKTRTVSQVRSHAQKYFFKKENDSKKIENQRLQAKGENGRVITRSNVKSSVNLKDESQMNEESSQSSVGFTPIILQGVREQDKNLTNPVNNQNEMDVENEQSSRKKEDSIMEVESQEFPIQFWSRVWMCINPDCSDPERAERMEEETRAESNRIHPSSNEKPFYSKEKNEKNDIKGQSYMLQINRARRNEGFKIISVLGKLTDLPNALKSKKSSP